MPNYLGIHSLAFAQTHVYVALILSLDAISIKISALNWLSSVWVGWKSQERYRPKERESCQQSGFTLTWHQQHTYSVRLPIYPANIAHTAEPVFPRNPNKARKPHTKTSGRRQQLNVITMLPCVNCHTCLISMQSQPCQFLGAVFYDTNMRYSVHWHLWVLHRSASHVCRVWHGFSTNCKKDVIYISVNVGINVAWKIQS